MKRVLIVAALMLAACGGVSAQRLHMDSATNMRYVNVAPVELSEFEKVATGCNAATRMYVVLKHDNLHNYGQFVVYVHGTVQVDSVTQTHPLIRTTLVEISGSDYDNWDANDHREAFAYCAAKLKMTIND